MFVPHCCNAINQIATSKSNKWPFIILEEVFPDTYFFYTDEEVLNEEELDKELLWNLQLLSEVSETYFSDILCSYSLFCAVNVEPHCISCR